jgi:hypothetical protein
MVEVAENAQDSLVDDNLVATVRPRLSWGAVFGGAVVGLGLWLLLYAFGLAVGLTVLDPSDPSSLKPSGIFTGVWSLIAPLIALFLGGLVAGRMSGVLRVGDGAIHGLAMWGLTTLIGACLVMMALAAAISSVAAAGGSALAAGGSTLGAAVAGAAGGAPQLGLDADDALRPINQRLQAQGKPPVTAEQLQAAARDTVRRAAREGRLDRELLASSIARQTALSEADVRELTERIQNQVGPRLESAAQAAKVGALRAAEASGKAFWGVFAALLLGLFAAVAGGAVGANASRHRMRPQPAPVPVRLVHQPPPIPPREVYP